MALLEVQSLKPKVKLEFQGLGAACRPGLLKFPTNRRLDREMDSAQAVRMNTGGKQWAKL